MSTKRICSIAASAALMVGPATTLADNNYISLSAGWAKLSDSSNTGVLTGDFVTGQGTTIPAGVMLPAGTELGWETQVDEGFRVGAAFGRQFDNGLRAEIELDYQKNDVQSHSGVQVAGIPLDAEDAGVLITGSGNLGVSVGDLVADGQGSIKGTYVMFNAFYDFARDGRISPYVGGGIGFGKVDADYSPSGVEIISGDENRFAYQFMAGATFGLSEATNIYLGYRYRKTSDATINARLLPAELKVENQSSTLEIGLRFNFN